VSSLRVSADAAREARTPVGGSRRGSMRYGPTDSHRPPHPDRRRDRGSFDAGGLQDVREAGQPEPGAGGFGGTQFGGRLRFRGSWASGNWVRGSYFSGGIISGDPGLLGGSLRGLILRGAGRDPLSHFASSGHPDADRNAAP
jgi:hypothetical protein